MIYRFGVGELDEERLLLRMDGEPVSIQPRAFAVLAYLLRHRDRVVTKDELMDRFWPDVAVEPAALNRALYLARRAVGDDARTQALIATVPRVGFRFVAPAIESVAKHPVDPAGDALVGRGELLERLRTEVDAAMDGAGRALLLHGEAGIGKTRIAREILDLAEARGATILAGRCSAGEGTPPWWPWLQLLREAVCNVPAARLADTLGEGAPTLATLLPSLRTRIPGLDAPAPLDTASARFRMLDALVCFLRAASQEHPVAVLIDDLHWADRSSLRALAHAIPDLPGLPVLLVGTFRKEDAGAVDGLSEVLAASSRNANDAQIPIDALSQADTAALMEALLGNAPSKEQAAALWERTGGNPLFARQLVQLIREEGPDSGDLEKRILESLPPALSGVIESRIAGISDACRTVLVHGAALGAEFDVDLLESLCGEDRPALVDALDEASTRGLLRTTGEGRLRFSHVLIQEALHGLQAPSERGVLERRIAEVIEKQRSDTLDSVASELALRTLAAARAGSGEAEKALYWADRACTVAMERLAWDEAVGMAERALEAAGLQEDLAPGRRAELWCALGAASNRAGNVGRARAAYEEAAALASRAGDAELLARAALGLGHELLPFETGVADPTQQRIVEDALERVPASEPALRSRLIGRLLLVRTWSGESGDDGPMAQEAVNLARAAKDPVALSYALGSLYVTRERLSTLASQLELTDQLVAAAVVSGDEHLAIWARHLRVIEALKVGRRSAAQADIEEMSACAEALRLPVARSRVSSLQAGQLLLEGRLEAGEALALQALALGSASDPTNAMQAFGSLAFYIRMEQGRLMELEDQVRALVAQYPNMGAWKATLSLFLSEAGRPDEARKALHEALGEGLAGIDEPLIGVVAATVAAQVCATLGDERSAEALAPCLVALAGMQAVGPVGYYGPLALFGGATAGVLRRFEEAEALLVQGEAEAAELGSPPYALRARLEQARLRLRRGAAGDVEAARQLCLGIVGEAEGLGLARLAQRAAALAEGDSAA